MFDLTCCFDMVALASAIITCTLCCFGTIDEAGKSFSGGNTYSLFIKANNG
jgi:hypothetical protein